jgi:predicted MPP superfamily phosphohydrolase
MTRADHPPQRKFLRRLLIFLAALLGMALFGYVYVFRIEPFWYKVERVEITVEGLPPAFKDFRIVCLSDFHQEPRASLEYIDRVVQRVNDLAPDIVCLLGDYVFSSAEAITELAPALGRLQASNGVFGILGNHDLWTDADVIRSGLEMHGVRMLVNEHVRLGSQKNSLVLAGLDDGWSGQPDLDQALAGAPEDAPIILMMHEPDFADQLSQGGRVDLQLSGHSHGGQVRLPFIGAPFLPKYARKYDQGQYRIGEMWLYISRGIGVIYPPGRFNCRPEITEIVLVNPGE